jgi:hypothetical protein
MKDVFMITTSVGYGVALTILPYSSVMQNATTAIIGNNELAYHFIHETIGFKTNTFLNVTQLWGSIGRRFIIKNFTDDTVIFQSTTCTPTMCKIDVVKLIFHVEAFTIFLLSLYCSFFCKKKLAFNDNFTFYFFHSARVLIPTIYHVFYLYTYFNKMR